MVLPVTSADKLCTGHIPYKGYSDARPTSALLSILLQIILAFFFGHAYDMRIFMATGYLVGTGQNPYIAQNLSAVFHNSTFQGITSLVIRLPGRWSWD